MSNQRPKLALVKFVVGTCLPTILAGFCLAGGSTHKPDLKWVDVNGVRIPEPPAEHPRLYVRARDLPDLKRRLGHPVLKPAWDDLQAAAKTNPQTRLELAALRCLLERDAALGRATIAETLRLLAQMKLNDKMNDSRRIGRMMVTAAIVYDWCYPDLGAEDKTAFNKELVRLARSLECGYPPDKGSFVIGHPSEWMILRDLLSAGVAVHDEDPEMYRLAAGRIFRSHVPARNWWYQGHAYHQGPGYADARFVSDMYALWIFDRLGAGNVFNPAQQFVPYEWIYLRRPDAAFVRSGDGENWPTRMGTLLCASYYGDGYLLANYRKESFVDDPANGRQGYDPRMDKLFECLWRDPDLQALPVSALPLSRYFGFPFGWMVARTGWDERSVIAQMRMNIYNFGGHQHLDAGSFDIYYKGPLAIHSGVYQGVNGGYGSPHHSNYYKRTIAHNCLLIHDPDAKFLRGKKELGNDGGQRLVNNGQEARVLEDYFKGDFKTATVLGHGFGPDADKPSYTYLKGDITAAYPSSVAREVKRSCVFLNLGTGPVPAALVVFDRVVSTRPTLGKYWLLQCAEEPAIKENTATVTLSHNGWTGKLHNTTLLPEADNVRIDKVGGPGKEFWVFGKNYPNVATPPDPEMGGWRVEVSPRRPADADMFLNVLQVMDSAEPTPLKIEKVTHGSMTGVRLADRLVLFQADGQRTAGPVSFTVRGQGTIRILVTDLAEGVWQVWRDGKIARPAAVVSTDSGVLYFEGPAGDYSLRH